MHLGTPTLNELPIDVPRQANFTASTQTARLFLLFLVFFTVSLLWYLASRDLSDMNALKAQGRNTLAHVVGKHIYEGKSKTYYLDYTFDGDGIWVDGEESVGRDEYSDTQPGEIIPLVFLPSHPQTYRLGAMTQERIEAQRDKWLWGEFGAFVFFSLLLVGAETTFQQHRSLLRNGLVVAGTVVELSGGPAQKAFFVSYQFLVDGRFAAASRTYSKKVACPQSFHNQIEIGQALSILYNPAHPSQNIPYRLLADVTLSHR